MCVNIDFPVPERQTQYIRPIVLEIRIIKRAVGLSYIYGLKKGKLTAKRLHNVIIKDKSIRITPGIYAHSQRFEEGVVWHFIADNGHEILLGSTDYPVELGHFEVETLDTAGSRGEVALSFQVSAKDFVFKALIDREAEIAKVKKEILVRLVSRNKSFPVEERRGENNERIFVFKQEKMAVF